MNSYGSIWSEGNKTIVDGNFEEWKREVNRKPMNFLRAIQNKINSVPVLLQKVTQSKTFISS